MFQLFRNFSAHLGPILSDGPVPIEINFSSFSRIFLENFLWFGPFLDIFSIFFQIVQPLCPQRYWNQCSLHRPNSPQVTERFQVQETNHGKGGVVITMG